MDADLFRVVAKNLSGEVVEIGDETGYIKIRRAAKGMWGCLSAEQAK